MHFTFQPSLEHLTTGKPSTILTVSVAIFRNKSRARRIRQLSDTFGRKTQARQNSKSVFLVVLFSRWPTFILQKRPIIVYTTRSEGTGPIQSTSSLEINPWKTVAAFIRARTPSSSSPCSVDSLSCRRCPAIRTSRSIQPPRCGLSIGSEPIKSVYRRGGRRYLPIVAHEQTANSKSAMLSTGNMLRGLRGASASLRKSRVAQTAFSSSSGAVGPSFGIAFDIDGVLIRCVLVPYCGRTSTAKCPST